MFHCATSKTGESLMGTLNSMKEVVKELKLFTKNLSILYVEDEDELREQTAQYLKKIFDNVALARDGEEALNHYRNGSFDIVISDIQMPNMNGIELAQKIKELNNEQEIVFVSAYTQANYFLDAIKLEVSDYIIKPMDFAQVNKTLLKISKRIKTFQQNIEYKNHLEDMIEKRTQENSVLEKDKSKNYENTLKALVELIDGRDTYTGGHSQRVANYSKQIAKALGFSSDDCELVYQAGVMHDIGKVSIPDAILLKPGTLDTIEYQLITEHVQIGYDLLSHIPMYKDISQIIIYHHERHNGKGYPRGIKGNDIPPLARIMCIADTFDAMTTSRIYKSRKTTQEAIDEIKQLSGTDFHPDTVKVAVKVLSAIEVSDSITQGPQNAMENARFSYFFKDQITDAYNEDFFDYIVTQNKYEPLYKNMNAIFLHNFDAYNKAHSWDHGNELLKKVSTFLSKEYKESLVFRIHGDDFFILSQEDIVINLKTLKNLPELENSLIGVSTAYYDLEKEHFENLQEWKQSIM